MLDRGYNIWGAVAYSDYHNETLDRAPCSFSRTHLAAGNKDYAGVISAMKSGTFWADHGNLLENLQFSIELEGLTSPAYPGAVVQVDSKSETAVVNISIERGRGSLDAEVVAEIISNCATGEPAIVQSAIITRQQTRSVGLVSLITPGADSRSCYMRARLQAHRDNQSNFAAYTNPIRIIF